MSLASMSYVISHSWLHASCGWIHNWVCNVSSCTRFEPFFNRWLKYSNFFSTHLFISFGTFVWFSHLQFSVLANWTKLISFVKFILLSTQNMCYVSVLHYYVIIIDVIFLYSEMTYLFCFDLNFLFYSL